MTKSLLKGQPFRTFAPKYHDMGLSVFPVGIPGKPKEPCVKWQHLQEKRLSNKTLDSWVTRFPSSNIGLVTGKLNGIVVVDNDNPFRPHSSMMEQFGETPVFVNTPSGGSHYFYKYEGERSSSNMKEKLDIKSDGGFVLVPGSYNSLTNKGYNFVSEDLLTSLNELPLIKRGAYEALVGKKGGIIFEGERNSSLFYHLKDNEAMHATSRIELFHAAIAYNTQFLDPILDIRAVSGTVDKVWEYKQVGCLYIKGGALSQYIKLYSHEFRDLSHDALYLLIFIRFYHYNRKEGFVLCANRIDASLNMNEHRVRRARHELLEKGYIVCIKPSLRKIGFPAFYALARPLLNEKTSYNIINTSPQGNREVMNSR